MLLGLVLAALAATAASAPATASAAASPRPNVLIVVTDDQMEGTVTPEIMPNVVRELEQDGLRFTNAFVTLSWCCPSRASILTGQYAHTNGVWTTGGGFSREPWQAHESDTLAMWLHDAGYRTGIVGKYMNWFGVSPDTTYHPPGWDSTAIMMNLIYRINPGYFDYDLFEDGTVAHYGTAAADYSTRVLTRKARQFVAPRSDGEPWFLYLAYTAPHGPGTPDPLDASSFADLVIPLPRSVCERDVGDKPLFPEAAGMQHHARAVQQEDTQAAGPTARLSGPGTREDLR